MSYSDNYIYKLFNRRFIENSPNNLYHFLKYYYIDQLCILYDVSFVINKICSQILFDFTKTTKREKFYYLET